MTAGLRVLYDFRGDGPVIKDRSGIGKPIDLRIGNPGGVVRSAGSLTIRKEAKIVSQQPATKLIQSVKQSGELTIEAWIQPANSKQDGPARIVTLSKDPNQRNFTLGQDGGAYDVRFRTKSSSANGIPSLATPKNAVNSKKISHVVYTRNRGGQARVYIDGKPLGRRDQKGSLNNWAADFKFALAGEVSGSRTWLGTYHLVAIYSRALSNSDVRQNYRAGHRASGGGAPSEAELLANRRSEQAQFFETKIAPLLSQHCLECHDSASQEGGLDLSRKTRALAGGDTGKAIIAGKPADSLVWQAVKEDSMPHDRPPLSSDEKAFLRQWIQSGAAWTVDYVDPAIYRNVREGENWVQRLTVPEYIESVRAAVGVDISKEAWRILPQDKRADGFRNTAYNLNVDLEHVESYAKLAELIVSKMDTVAFARRFSKSKQLTDDNMRALIAEMGKRVLRGPLEDYEVVLYRGISTTVASAGGDFREAVGMILEAMLQSPRFIYRIENQVGDGTLWPVDEYELATRMSYILWGAPADEALVAAAESGDLSDREMVRRQITRMLKDPRAVERSKQFVIEWLNLDRLSNMRPDATKFPGWTPQLAEDMREETIAYFLDIVWNQKRPLSELLNAQFTYVTPRLARHYGIDAQGDDFTRYDLSQVPSRGGLLTQGSVLTIGGDDASMVTRGLFVLNDLLFSEVGDPPPGLDTTPVPTSPGRTHRAIAMERVESTSCGGCHSRFEPLAYGLEMFDGLGTFHKVDEHGNQLRQDGEILFPGEAKPTPYKTSAEMMDLLAKSERVSQCLTRKVTQFALARPLRASDAPAVREIHQRAQREGGTYSSLVTAIIMSDLVQMTRTEKQPED